LCFNGNIVRLLDIPSILPTQGLICTLI
jgi:hypothetical protein